MDHVPERCGLSVRELNYLDQPADLDLPISLLCNKRRPSCDFIPFSEDIFNLDANAWMPGPDPTPYFFNACGPWFLPGTRCVVHEIGRQEFIERVRIARIEGVVDARND